MEWSDVWAKITDYSIPIISTVPGGVVWLYNIRRLRNRDLTALEVAQNNADLQTRKMLSSGQEALFNRMRDENADLRKRTEKAEAEADDAWKQVRRLDAELAGRAKTVQPPFNM